MLLDKALLLDGVREPGTSLLEDLIKLLYLFLMNGILRVVTHSLIRCLLKLVLVFAASAYLAAMGAVACMQ